MESFHVSRSIRSIVLFAATVCFLAMALDVVLYVHLANVEDPAGHDAGHCPLCQQLLVSKKDYTAEIGVTEVEIDHIGRLLTTCLDDLCPQTTSLSFHARAPPA